MLYLTSKFHDKCVNTFGFMEGGLLKPPPSPPAQELQKTPGGIGLILWNISFKTLPKLSFEQRPLITDNNIDINNNIINIDNNSIKNIKQ